MSAFDEDLFLKGLEQRKATLAAPVVGLNGCRSSSTADTATVQAPASAG